LTRTAKQETFTDSFSFKAEALAGAEFTDHRLIYLTPPLKTDVHISGTPRVTVKLAANKPAANLSVYLVSLPWESGRRTVITDNLITRGWADPQNAKSIRKSEPLKPGKFVTVSFDLMPDDQIIRAGQQIGLMIFSSDKEFTLQPEPGTEVTVDLGGTMITLPVVGGSEALKAAFEE
jgi:X-Pro dipeptidyl-peptidase